MPDPEIDYTTKADARVYVGRLWGQHEVTAAVTSEWVGAAMALDQFLVALVDVAGNPTLLVTKAQLVATLQASAALVLEGMKAETRHIVQQPTDT